MLSVVGLWQSDLDRAPPSLRPLQRIPAPAPETALGLAKPQLPGAPAGRGEREQSGELGEGVTPGGWPGAGAGEAGGNVPLSVMSLELLLASGHVGLEA